MLPNIKNFNGVNVTFLTTENCNLRCKYCYEINKKENHMSFETAKKAIDKLLQGKLIIKENMNFARQGLILDFMGGDALVNPKLLDDILSYFTYKVATVENEWTKIWRHRFRVSICSNGTLFKNKEVRDFCEKWKDILCLNISIDGCPEIHDMNRIFPDGRGTMNEILKWWKWYQEIFPSSGYSTKATCSRLTIPYLYKSLKFMHEKLGIKYINQNFIMEDGHYTEEDYKILKEQLKLCNQYIFDHRNEIYWSMVDIQFSDARNTLDENKARCGSGNMMTIGIDGKIYPCMRWLPVSLGENRPDMSTGNVKKGLTKKGRKIYTEICDKSKNAFCTKEEKCLTCEYESACAFCIAGCFTEFGDFIRTTHICEITKILCENAKVYQQMEKDADEK